MCLVIYLILMKTSGTSFCYYYYYCYGCSSCWWCLFTLSILCFDIPYIGNIFVYAFGGARSTFVYNLFGLLIKYRKYGFLFFFFCCSFCISVIFLFKAYVFFKFFQSFFSLKLLSKNNFRRNIAQCKLNS